MGDLALLGEVGGLAGAHHDPAGSTMALVRGAQVSERRFSWLMTYSNVDPGAIEVLLDMLGYLHHRVAAIRSVALATGPELTQGRSQRLPGARLPLPFGFEDDREGEDVRSPAIELRLFGRHPDTMLERFEDAFGRWFSVASAGGFASEALAPEQCRIYLGDEPVYAGNRLILFLDGFAMDTEAAMASLLDVWQWGHAHLAAIELVEIS